MRVKIALLSLVLANAFAPALSQTKHNAKVDKASASPRLSMQLRMFRDGRQVYAGAVTQLRLKPQPDWQRINVAGSLRLAANAQPGEYMIQLLITDTLAKEKYSASTQWADFEVIN